MCTNFLIASRQIVYLGLLFFILSSCERSVDGLGSPNYSINPEVFIDGFSGGLNYAAFSGSVPTAFNVDTEETYNNTKASMRFEVPDLNDPKGAYAGGVFFTSSPRDLSGYDALTFWVKASQPASLDIIGLGNDLGESKYLASLSSVAINTNWKKVILPLPDPSKLDQESGMLYYSTGPIDDRGYTFWIDEVKFEKLGTIAHPQHAILDGNDQVESSFTGITRAVDGLISVFNLPDGTNLSVDVATAYFDFTSSNESVATVNETGIVTIADAGTAIITATLGGVDADGSLTIESQGVFDFAPTPTDNPADVISLFSDAFSDVPVNYYNGYWAPWQTTLSADFTIDGDNVLNYTNFNFVGIEFSSPTVDATAMTHLRIDVYIPNALNPGATFEIELVDFGADGVFGGNDNTSHTMTYTSPTLVSQNWISFDIPLTSFSGLGSRAQLGQMIFKGANLSNFYADNIYFRK